MSELRQDLVSGDWVVIAPGRAKRPDQLIKKKIPRKRTPKSTCPFEDLEKSGNEPIALYPEGVQGNKWHFAVIPNKYPALIHSDERIADRYYGIYRTKPGVGDHELVIGRDHNKNLAELSPKDATALFEIFQERYRAVSAAEKYAYVSGFLNWGPLAGASIWHPHYQILTLPIIPPHILHSLRGSEEYFRQHHVCVRCEIIKMERKDRSRIIAQNSNAIAIAPYASKRPFEISILPRKHFSFFEKTPMAVIKDVAALAQTVLRNIKKHLHDPDLYLYIHSAPIDGGSYEHHHWHIEIVPVNVVSPPGGFEISTVVNINVIDPDEAAKILRGK
jgi:UDPglucose--hexose-1-phosphate uridylyltransferase